MSKRAYSGDSVIKSRKTRDNGNDNENSRKVLSRSELDRIAGEEEFVFVRKLNLGNNLYSNQDKTLMRIYTKTGEVLHTYSPKSCLQSTVEFHHPIACLPANLSNPVLRQYRGRSRLVR